MNPVPAADGRGWHQINVALQDKVSFRLREKHMKQWAIALLQVSALAGGMTFA